MQDPIVSLLASWESFYVIIGSSAAALTGLMFVVVTLIAGSREPSKGVGSIGAFGTPTVVHFCAALLVAALLSAPWHTLSNIGCILLLGLTGLGGVAYVVIVVLRARHQTDYQPVLEDWLWHMVFPLVAYTALFIAAFLLLSAPALALFIIGAVSVLLLFIGIHNSWDTVTYIALVRFELDDKKEEK